MAVISYGPIVDGARGSIGGTTFGRSSAGPTARRKPRPPEPLLLIQQQSKMRLQAASIRWRTLTQALRNDWNAYAATVELIDSLGHSYHPTGHQSFCWWLTWSKRAALTIVNYNAPTDIGLPTVPTLTFGVTDAPPTLYVTARDPAFVDGDFMTLASFRADSTRKFNRRPLHSYAVHFYAQGLPALVIYNLDAGLTSGIVHRFHIQYRFIDTAKRTSTLMKTYYDRLVP